MVFLSSSKTFFNFVESKLIPRPKISRFDKFFPSFYFLHFEQEGR